MQAILAFLAVLIKAAPIMLDKKPLFDELVASAKALFTKHGAPDVAADLAAVKNAGADADARKARLEAED